MSQRLKSFATSRPVAVLVIFLAAFVFGFFSYGQLPLALMPELSYPTLTVRTEYPGAAPEEVENDISRPIEEALGVISGLKRISSVSRAGVSDVVLELAWDTDISQATQDTLEKLDLVFLPEEAERPLILHYDPSLDPVMELSLAGSGERYRQAAEEAGGEEALRRLRRLAELQVKRQLEPIEGVAAVRVRGGLEEEIHIRIDEERLRRSGLPIELVINRLSQENVNVAGGTIKEGRTEFMVRTLNEYEDLSQIEETILAEVNGRQVRIKDLADVVWSHKERQMLTRTDGGPSVQIDIFKEADANIVALAERVRAALGELELDAEEGAEEEGEGDGEERAESAPGGRGGFGGGRGPGARASGLAQQLYDNEGALLQVVADRSLFIQGSIDEVVSAALLGGLFAVLVLYLFLRNFRTTAIIAVSIPISLLITFAPMNLFGVSLNIMSLGGLALGIGMLVDSSIVVLESIFRCREEGDDLVTAAVRGTDEVKGAVAASTLTSVAVFFPMVFVEGIAGQAFGDLGLAVVISLAASLVVAVYFIPMLASRRGFALAGNLPGLGGGDGPPADGDAETVDAETPAGDGERGAAGRGFGRGGLATWRWLRGEAGRLTAWLRRGWTVIKAPFYLLGSVYLLVVFTVGLVLEVVLLVLFGLLLGLLWVWRKAIGPLAVGLFKLLIALPMAVTGRALDALNRGYTPTVRWAVRNPLAMVVVVVTVLGLSVWLTAGLGSELLPEVHQGEVTFEVALPVGTPLAETEAALAPVEGAILAEAEHIEALILTVGYDPETSQRSDEGEHTARFKLLLDSSDPRVEEAVVRRVRSLLAEVPDVDARVTRPVLFSSKTPIEVEVYGDELPRLKRQADRVREEMAALPQLADVESSLRQGAPEVQIVYDRDRLARYGLNIRQVATLVRDQVKGFEATRFNLKDRRVPIVVRLGEEDRETVADVQGLLVNPGAPRPIPLEAVAAVTLGEGPSEVRRIDARRSAVVGSNIASGSMGAAVERIRERLTAEIDWPVDMNFLIAGQNQEWERSRGSLLLALALSIFLVYVIMAAQFESLLQPLVIMFTIPLAFFGTVLVLEVLSISLSVVVFLGMIMLAGIVVNNAIVLVDYANQLRRRGMGREEAVVTAGTVRLRPILMTTATTVLGLLPMALGLGDGAEIRTPMAIAVIGGLITSTGLTLIVIPALYAAVDRLRYGLDEGAWQRGQEARLGDDDEADDRPGAPAGASPAGAAG